MVGSVKPGFAALFMCSTSSLFFPANNTRAASDINPLNVLDLV